jgi:membrane-bound serine protease (ClpP class)
MRRREKPINLLLTMLSLGLIAAGLLSTLLPVTDLNAQDPPESEPPAKPLRPGVKVYVVHLHGEVDDNMVLFTKLAIERARKAGAEYIIFDINTPGGKMMAMEDIGKSISALKDIRTVAYVNRMAFSAGAYICLSCDEIYMARGASIGSATPILISPTGIEVSEKMTSAGRALFRAMAEKQGHNPDLAEAMVDMTIWLEWYKVVKDSKELGYLIVRKEKFNAEQKRLEKEGKTIEWEEDICTDKQLLNLTFERAKTYGLSRATTDSREQIYEHLGLVNPIVKDIELTFTEKVFFFLRSPAIVAILTLIGVVGILSEIYTPGFGVPGILGISAIALMMLTGYMVGTAELWMGLLVFAGIVLLAVEIFVIPGFGVAGILGLIFIAAGIVLSLVPTEWPETDWQWSYLLETTGFLALGLLGALVVMVALTRILPRTPVLRKLALATTAGAEEGFVVPSEEMKALLGRKGLAITKLRPAGKAEFGNRQFQVVAEGDLLDAGDEVEVIDVSGNKVTVRRVDKQ